MYSLHKHIKRQDRINKKFDHPSGKSKKIKKNNEEILKCLQEDHGFIPQRRRYFQEELHSLASQYNIPIKTEVANATTKGWYNSPKGILQVLYERGHIDIDNLSKYSMDGKRIKRGKMAKI